MHETCRMLIDRGEWYEDSYRNKCDFPVGPWNTISNMAYPIVGAHTFVYFGGTPASYAFLVSMCILGLGSFLYHGYKYDWANQLDWLGMWSVFGALWAHSLAPNTYEVAFIMLIASTIGAGLLVYAFKQIGANALVGLMLFSSAFPALWTPAWPLMVAALITFVIGYLFWMAGKTRPFVRWHPLNVAGHGLWHCTTSIAMGLMFIAQTNGAHSSVG